MYVYHCLISLNSLISLISISSLAISEKHNYLPVPIVVIQLVITGH